MAVARILDAPVGSRCFYAPNHLRTLGRRRLGRLDRYRNASLTKGLTYGSYRVFYLLLIINQRQKKGKAHIGENVATAAPTTKAVAIIGRIASNSADRACHCQDIHGVMVYVCL